MDELPQAVVGGKKRFSIVWLIPLVALLIGGWLTFTHLRDKGPNITIVFPSAEGLTAGKTRIKYKDVEVGVVDDIVFNHDLSKVLVTATLDSEMRPYLNEDTRFWVVRARLSVQKVEGLSTLLSGAYIGMEPGDGSAKKRNFEGLDSPPVLLQEDKGSRYLLESTSLHSLDVGTPVYFRHMQVGEVIDYRLDFDNEHFYIEVFVRAPYDQFVLENSAFWNAGGVDFTMNADGVELRSESLVSILLGGLAFDTLEDVPGPPASSGTVFPLRDSRSSAESGEYLRTTTYRLYFDSSARGLNPGAPVTLRGITVGQVTAVRLEYDRKKAAFQIPVTIEIESDRIAVVGEAGDEEVSTELLVKHGLRAQLRSGSLITGQMLVDLDMYPDAEPASVRREDGYVILPTIPTSIDTLKQSLVGFLEKVNAIPLEEITANLNGTIAGANELVQSMNDLVGSDEVASTLTSVSAAAAHLESTLAQAENVVSELEVGDIVGNINDAVDQLDATLKQAGATLASFGDKSDIYRSALGVMNDLSLAIRSLRQMAEYLERHPEALLKGKTR